MLYELEYWCRLCGKWLELGGPPWDDGNAALAEARRLSTPDRPVRVVDDFGRVWY
jgi:hypothetical protein